MPPIKTKAEAIERLAPGDRWEKDGKKLLYFRKIAKVIEFRETSDEVLYFDISGQICATTPKAFRRWAKTADYLGNSK